MTRILIELIVQLAIFLEEADEASVPLEVAVKLQEEMAYKLQQLNANERLSFVEMLDVISMEPGFSQYRDILSRMPVEFGLV